MPRKKLMLFTSQEVIAPGGTVDDSLVAALKKIQHEYSLVACVSNRAEPSWFSPAFDGSNVQFLKVVGRRNGEIIRDNATRLKVPPQNCLVLAGSQSDVAMAKNGKAIPIAYGMDTSGSVLKYGIRVANAADLLETLRLSDSWSGGWWYQTSFQHYRVLALADLSTLRQSSDQTAVATQIRDLVKQGGPRLFALTTILTRSLLVSGVSELPSMFWGLFPSSNSDNEDTEILSELTHRLRTNVSNVRFSKRKDPLFIRHKPSTKRSAGSLNRSRTDPSNQVETLHLNPKYRGKLKRRDVVILDDCTTYGVSFGVAAAFLRRAGVQSVLGVAIGKFGNCLSGYDISIDSDPFAPVSSNDWSCIDSEALSEDLDKNSQKLLTNLFLE